MSIKIVKYQQDGERCSYCRGRRIFCMATSYPTPVLFNKKMVIKEYKEWIEWNNKEYE